MSLTRGVPCLRLMAALRGAAVPAMPDAFAQPRLLDRSTIGEPQLSTRASFASKALAPDHAPMKAMLAFAPLAARPNMWDAVRWSSSEAKEGEKKKAEGEVDGKVAEGGSAAEAAETKAGEREATVEEGAKAGEAGATVEEGAGEMPSYEDVLELLKLKEASHEELTAKVETLTDSLKRSLAEMENVRMRAAKENESAKKFALQGFVKAVLDVADNLERAAAVVPPEALEPPADGSAMDSEKMRLLLKGLLEGVTATEKIMLHVLKMNGVVKYDPMNEKFDPNFHAALFEIPDPTKEVGTVGVCTKKGYTLHGRVIRPADVGVVRAP